MSNPYEAAPHRNPSSSSGRVRVVRVGILSVGLYGATAGAIVGLIVGAFGFLGSLLGVRGNVNPAFALGVGAGMLLFGPLLYGFVGFIGGIVNALVYNVVASFSGGIQVELARN